MSPSFQSLLSPLQIEAFYHDHFVEAQVRDYIKLAGDIVPSSRGILDVGGGCGYFALALQSSNGLPVTVLDMDPTSVAKCRSQGVVALPDLRRHKQHNAI